MAVSVIVSNFNGARFLPRLLDTLRAQRAVTLEILIVDRHSNDDSLAYLAKQPDVHVLHERPESGLVTGYDVGVPHARYEHLFFCNEDMWFDPDCLHQLEKRIDLTRRASRRADPWLGGPMTAPKLDSWRHKTLFSPCRWNLAAKHRIHFANTISHARSERAKRFPSPVPELS